MQNIDYLQDILQWEIKNQELYNKYAIDIQNPEIRQMLIQLRDNKMQQITTLQNEIMKLMQ